MGVTALSEVSHLQLTARARIDKRMTCAKDIKHASCRVRPRLVVREDGEPAGRKASHTSTCIWQKSTHTGARSGTQERMGISHGCRVAFSAELSTSSVDRRTTVGGASSIVRCVIVGVEGSGEWKVSVETLTQTKHTHDTAQRVVWHALFAYAHRRGSGLSLIARAQTRE
jgi:hypothetical protein